MLTHPGFLGELAAKLGGRLGGLAEMLGGLAAALYLMLRHVSHYFKVSHGFKRYTCLFHVWVITF